MEPIKNEILTIIELFKLGSFQGSRTIENNFVDKYTKTEFWTENGTFTHFFKNK
jgi:hypothetical protein